MKKPLQNQKVVLASHISDLTGPSEALAKYLAKNSHDLTIIFNPLEYCTEKKRSVSHYVSRKMIDESFPPNYHPNAIVSWLIDFFVTFKETFSLKEKIDLFLACDPLMGIVGVIFKKLKRIDKLVLYTIDWTDRRFNNRLLNKLYYLLDHLVANNSDAIWCISTEIFKIRKLKYPRKNIVHVPVGVYPSEIKTFRKYNKWSLVLLGAFEKSKGIDSLLTAWPLIHQKFPDTKLVFIGKTPSSIKTNYEKLIAELPNTENLGILGHEKVLKNLGKYGIGLAPYPASNSTISKYADPSRIKDYLACGLPVITTPIPPIHKIIEQKQYGVVVKSTEPEQMLMGIEQVLTHYSKFRQNVSNQKANFGTGVIGHLNNPTNKPIHHIRGITHKAMKEMTEYHKFKLIKAFGYEHRIKKVFYKFPAIAPVNIFVAKKHNTPHKP